MVVGTWPDGKADRLIIYRFTSRSRIFHFYNYRRRAANLGLSSALKPSRREGSLSCHICCNMGLGFSGLIRRNAPFSRLLRHTKACGGYILTRILTGKYQISPCSFWSQQFWWYHWAKRHLDFFCFCSVSDHPGFYHYWHVHPPMKWIATGKSFLVMMDNQWLLTRLRRSLHDLIQQCCGSVNNWRVVSSNLECGDGFLISVLRIKVLSSCCCQRCHTVIYTAKSSAENFILYWIPNSAPVLGWTYDLQNHISL
jgi:hypothetical protein